MFSGFSNRRDYKGYPYYIKDCLYYYKDNPYGYQIATYSKGGCSR